MQRQVLVLFVACALCLRPSIAFAAPAQQSECEIEHNRYRAAHPDGYPGDVFKSGVLFGLMKDTSPTATSSHRDTKSGIVFSVENDGRHILAHNTDGNLLWRRNPFVEWNLCPYRSAHPYITWIGPSDGDFGRHYTSAHMPKPDADANTAVFSFLTNKFPFSKAPVKPPRNGDQFIGLAFDSSQFGYLNIRNGDFYYLGQN